MDAAATKNAPLGLIIAAFAAIYIVWGSTYLAIRFAIETIPPFLMAGVRFLFAGLLLYVWVRRSDRTPVTFAHWKATAVVGGLMLVGGPGLVSWSEQFVPSGLTALLIATVPLWMVALDWLLHKGPRPNLAIMLGIAGGLTGVYLLIGPANISGERVHPIGGGTLLLACLLWSLGSLRSRAAHLPANSLTATAMEMTCAGVGLLLLGTLTGEWAKLDVARISMKSVLATGYLAIFGSIIALSAYTWLLRVASAARVATYAYVNPVVAMLLGAWLAEEVLTPRALVAAAVIVGSVVIITLAKRRQSPQQTTDAPRAADAAGITGHTRESACLIPARTRPSQTAPPPYNAPKEAACGR